MLATLLRLVIALALSLAPAAMAQAMPAASGHPMAMAAPMPPCPPPLHGGADPRCAQCVAALPAYALGEAAGNVAGRGSLPNFHHRTIGPGVDPEVATPPPR